MPSNLASMLDVVTVFCFMDLQSIGPPKRLNRYPSVLWRDKILLAYTASLEHVNGSFDSFAENSMALLYVMFRYTIVWSATCWYVCDGFCRNSHSLEAGHTTSGLVIMAAYRIDLT